ncbi:MAG: hypothetical protein F4X31_13095 [Gammaproteobacteria bacterium]|nr:hypothetical protein [Gammaproteobacteria bacterium]
MIDELGVPYGVRLSFIYNGGCRGEEDHIAAAMASEQNYRGIGGSDAHIVSHIGRCATRFDGAVGSEGELAEALRGGGFEALSFREQA